MDEVKGKVPELQFRKVNITISDKPISKEEFYDFLARLLIKNGEYKSTAHNLEVSGVFSASHFTS
jgi:hypothetical protein